MKMNSYEILMKEEKAKLEEKAYGLEIVDYALYDMQTKKRNLRDFLIYMINYLLMFTLGFVVAIWLMI